MAIIESAILGFQAVLFGIFILIIIYLIFMRIDQKKNETFEKRDN